MLVFLNGEFINEQDAKISISDLSYQFGYGLFETIKCENGSPIFFEAHYKRLTHSAKEIGMEFPVDKSEIKIWIENLLKKNSLKAARVKIIISKKGDGKFNVSIFCNPLEQLPESYSLLTYTLSRDINSVSFRNKTTSRADSYVAYKKSQESGFNDALYINEKREIVECTRANIFLVLENKIITPVLESGILSGVTREKLIEVLREKNITVEEKNINVLYLNKAIEVFITNAIIGIMPVSKIKLEDKEYNFLNHIKTNEVKEMYGIKQPSLL